MGRRREYESNADRQRAYRERQAYRPAAVSTYRTLVGDFANLLDYEVLYEARKRQLFLIHPDRGGDLRRTQQLMECWQKIEKERKKS
jgi:hypothetical protein